MTRPSELRRRRGIQFIHRFALIRCECRNHIVVTRGQTRRLCPYCGRKFWLHDLHVVFQSDDLGLLRNLMAGSGNYYHPDGFTTADKLLRSPSALGPHAPNWSSRRRGCGPGRHRESVVT